MNRRMRIFANTLPLSLTTAAVAQQKPSNTIDASITLVTPSRPVFTNPVHLIS
jgi:hypothetical protein